MPRKINRFALTAGLALAGASLSTAAAQSPRAAGRMNQEQVMSMIASWPNSSRMAAIDMMKKYGMPTEMTASMLM